LFKGEDNKKLTFGDEVIEQRQISSVSAEHVIPARVDACDAHAEPENYGGGTGYSLPHRVVHRWIRVEPDHSTHITTCCSATNEYCAVVRRLALNAPTHPRGSSDVTELFQSRVRAAITLHAEGRQLSSLSKVIRVFLFRKCHARCINVCLRNFTTVNENQGKI